VYVYIIKIYIELHLCGYICICKYMHIYLTRVRGERMLVYPNWYVDDFPGLLVIGIRSSSYKWANALVPPTPFSGRSGGERSKRPTCAVVQTCKCYRDFEGLGSVNIDCGTMNRMY
jgi:hypothetical protein